MVEHDTKVIYFLLNNIIGIGIHQRVHTTTPAITSTSKAIKLSLRINHEVKREAFPNYT